MLDPSNSQSKALERNRNMPKQYFGPKIQVERHPFHSKEV